MPTGKTTTPIRRLTIRRLLCIRQHCCRLPVHAHSHLAVVELVRLCLKLEIVLVPASHHTGRHQGTHGIREIILADEAGYIIAIREPVTKQPETNSSDGCVDHVLQNAITFPL